MADNEKIYTETAINSVPKSTDKTGTVTIVAGNSNVIGSGTLFTTELVGGDYLVSLTTGEVRQVTEIVSDTELKIRNPFKTAAAGIVTRIVPKLMNILYMSMTAIGGDTTVNLNGNLRDGVPVEQGKPNLMGNPKFAVVPVVVDGGTAPVDVVLEYWDSFAPEKL